MGRVLSGIDLVSELKLYKGRYENTESREG